MQAIQIVQTHVEYMQRTVVTIATIKTKVTKEIIVTIVTLQKIVTIVTLITVLTIVTMVTIVIIVAIGTLFRYTNPRKILMHPPRCLSAMPRPFGPRRGVHNNIK